VLIGLVACVALLALGAIWLALASFTLSSNFQGRADPSGSWAIAWGIALGPLAVTGIAAAQVKPFLTCHLFGKQLARVPLARFSKKKRPATAAQKLELATEQPAREPTERSHGGARFLQSLDPIDAVLSWWQSERVLALQSLLVDVNYSFRDVALTGRILAALYVLSAVLPVGCEIRQTPNWESVDRVALEADGKLRFWPGRLAIWCVRFVLEQRSAARASARLAKRATESS